MVDEVVKCVALGWMNEKPKKFLNDDYTTSGTLIVDDEEMPLLFLPELYAKTTLIPPRYYLKIKADYKPKHHAFIVTDFKILDKRKDYYENKSSPMINMNDEE